MKITRREFMKFLGLFMITAPLRIQMPLKMPSFDVKKRSLEKNGKAVKIKVIGVGGAGGNIIDSLVKFGLNGIELIAANTDSQFLEINEVPCKILLGSTNDLYNKDLETGYKAALENKGKIKMVLEGSDIVFIVAGMGGCTGTGGAPVVAKIGKEIGAWTIAIVTLPFCFEGKRRVALSKRGLEWLKETANMTIVIPNDCIFKMMPPSANLLMALQYSDKIFCEIIRDFLAFFKNRDMISCLDIKQIKTMFGKVGIASLGIGEGNSLKESIESALSCPLLEGTFLKRITKILAFLRISGNETLEELRKAVSILDRTFDKKAILLWDTIIDEDIEKPQVKVILGRKTC